MKCYKIFFALLILLLLGSFSPSSALLEQKETRPQIKYYDANSELARLKTQSLQAAQEGIVQADNGEEIVFSLGNDIWVQFADGTGRRKLIEGGAGYSYLDYPAWSLDGTRIAFGARPSTTPYVELWTVKADGSDLKMLTQLTQGYFGNTIQSISWSWDSNYIMFNYVYDDVQLNSYMVVTTIHSSGSGLTFGPDLNWTYSQYEPFQNSSRFAYLHRGFPVINEKTTLHVSNLNLTGDETWFTYNGAIAGLTHVCWNTTTSIYTIIRWWSMYPNREVLLRIDKGVGYTVILYSDPGGTLWSPTVSPDRTKLYNTELLGGVGTMYLSTLGSNGLPVSITAKGLGLFPNWRQTIPPPQPTSYVKNDFNQDGQGDILWRNYATGANALWYMGNSGASLVQSQSNFEHFALDHDRKSAQIYQDVLAAGDILHKDERVYNDVMDVDAPREKIVEKVFWDVMEAGEALNKPDEGNMVRNMQELMSPENLKAGVQALSIIGTTYLTKIADTNWKIGGTGDFNGDGKVDILWRNYVSGANALWYMNGSTISGTAYLTKIADTNWRIEATGDFNGDGKVDILWRNYVSGTNALWYMNGSTISGTAYLTKIADTNWRIEATGDFNGDGKVDILWRNYVSGTNALWYMNGSTISGTAYLTKIADTNWRIEGAGDFNGDGKVDILWRNYMSGANALWYMNGSTISSTAYLTKIADTNWTIENH